MIVAVTSSFGAGKCAKIVNTSVDVRSVISSMLSVGRSNMATCLISNSNGFITRDSRGVLRGSTAILNHRFAVGGVSGLTHGRSRSRNVIGKERTFVATTGRAASN